MRRLHAACFAVLAVATAARAQEDREVRIGRVTVRGALSPGAVKRVARRGLNMLRYCYESQLAQQPDLAGSVVVELVVGRTGDVPTARAHDDAMASPRLEECLAGAVRRWTFPAPTDGGVAVVELPVTFAVPGPTGGGRGWPRPRPRRDRR